MKKIILLATSFLFMADMYAQTRDSLEVTHTVSIENPDRVTLRQSDKQLTVENRRGKWESGFSLCTRSQPFRV